MAKLYVLSYSALWKLSKIFLNDRYDSHGNRDERYSLQQLYTSTLLLTIVLFLMPNVMVFYAVFAAFRLTLMIIGETVPMWIYMAVRSIPLYEAFLLICQPLEIRRKRHLEGEVETIESELYRLKIVHIQDKSLWTMKKVTFGCGTERLVFSSCASLMKVVKDLIAGNGFRAQLMSF
ncbi:hypothetical protein ACOME3_001274 [Neoechinorhynchus agilis]